MTVQRVFISLLITYSVFGQSNNYIYQENFDNKGNWPIGSNDIRDLNVFNGRYYFEHKRTDKSWRISTTDFNLDTSKDFEIETSIQKISGIDNSGIQFLYDFKDDSNYKELGFSSNGYFRIAESVNGTYSNIKKWEKSDKIKTGNYGVNNLKVSKKGNSLTFYINEKEIYTMPYKSFVGKQIGVAIFKNQKISIDYISVKQSTSVINNNNNSTVLYDNFYSNNNSWAVQNNDEATLEISNGKYYFEYKDVKGFTSTRIIDLDNTKDFKIEASFQKINGIQNNGFGLVFGREDGGNQNQFFIAPSGSFAIDEYKNSKLNSLKNWTASSAIEKGNLGKNKLTIEKINSTYNLYINKTNTISTCIIL